MGLLQSFEQQGNILFKYRGQLPIFFFLLAIPFSYLTNYSFYSDKQQNIFIILGIFLSILGFLFRFYTIATTPKGTSGRNTKKQIANTLNSSGIYSILRHPLYFGNYLIWLGISLTTFNLYFVIIVSLLFWVYYERIMFAEEQFLKRKFGKDYINWSNSVPAFFPAFLKYKESTIPFSIISILRREYSSVFSAVIGFTYIEILRNYIQNGIYEISQLTFQILISIILIVIVLKILKHYTQILNEDDRS